MALFDRGNRDREGRSWGGSPEYGGQRGGFMGGVRRGMQRLENGVRDAFDRGGYDHDYSAGSSYGSGYGDRSRWGMGGGTMGGPSMSAGRWGNGGDMETTGYDRDFGRGMSLGGGGDDLNRYGQEVGDQGNYGYRGMEGGWSTMRNHGRYDEDFGGRGWSAGYDRDYGSRRGMMGGGMMGGGMDMTRHRGWDQGDMGYRGHDRMQTDAGDPFGDRASHTPFRMMRGGFDRYETDRGGWGEGNRLNRLGPGGDYDGDFRARDTRGWNQGIGDDPYYGASDLRGYDRDIGRRPNRDRDWF